MDLEKYRLLNRNYAFKISQYTEKINRAKVTNEQRSDLQEKKQASDELLANLLKYMNVLQVIKSRAVKENEDFRTRRLDLLSSSISENLATIFPDEGYDVKVSCSFNRRDNINLTVTNQRMETMSPKMSSGKLQQYLISFSSICCITKALGKKAVYVDEAFGASSTANLPLIGDLIGKLSSEDGMQLILVSQNAALYQDIPGRREIYLETNKETHNAEVADIKDY